MFIVCFFFNDTATTEIYTYLHTLSLHDALPISLSLPSALLASAILMAASPARAADPQPGSLPPDAIPHASVLMFHRFGENTVPSTNIRLDQFDAMLAALKSGGYHVLPLRSEERRVGKGCVSTCRSRWSPYH